MACHLSQKACGCPQEKVVQSAGELVEAVEGIAAAIWGLSLRYGFPDQEGNTGQQPLQLSMHNSQMGRQHVS